MNSPETISEFIKIQPTQILRAFDFLYFQRDNYPLKDCLAAKVKGKWQTFTTQEVIDTVNHMSLGFLKAGISKGDKVAIISNNRPEWNAVDFGLQQIGAISVPLYPTITEADYKFIFGDAGVKMIFVGSEDLYKKAINATKDISGIEGIYSFDQIEGVKYWKDIERLGENEDVNDLEVHKNQISEEDLLTIIYTSGTTGNPKGVMLTHKNVVSNALAVSKESPVAKGVCRTLSFLPACHIFERTGLYYFINCGIAIYYAESMEMVAENLREVKPHFFNTVPRLLEKMYDRILAKGHELTGLKRQLFFWAVNLGLQYEPNRKMGWWYDQQLKLANKLIFSKWREALGGNMVAICSGAAALQPRLAKIFWAAQIKILEAYGMTETSPGISFTRADASHVRVGCVGEALENVVIKIAEDGEILVKSPGVMKGYYNHPELTAQVIDEEGWLHTGDIGEMVENRFLKITDRKKEMFKTSGGKYVAPQLLENKFKESLLIEQIMVIGENRKFPGALVTTSELGLQDLCKQKNIAFTTTAEVVKNPEIIAVYKQEIDKYNENFAHYEQVKKIALLAEPWSVVGTELTPTLKLKRKVILQKYHKQVEEMYG
ncbi:MAG: long-chain fatty acid--CoA ligase [Verrucomicrobia bacterium]|nr:long-chain fatty acid--CoA ligase [Cytophagales bacterium]